MVNLEWYRTFKAIYQHGTLTKAAQELMISQPNVSMHLAALENYIGKQLFVRLPRKMMPTEYGKLLYSQIVESIDNLERVESEIKRSILNKIPTIRFGTPSEIFYNYLAEYLGQQEELQFIVEYGLADNLIKKITDNELDIAIITKPNKAESNIIYEPLFSETFMIVCNPEFDAQEFDNYINQQNFTDAEKWLRMRKWYAYSNDLILIKRFWRENFKKRPILKLQATIPDNNAILKAVSNSNALTVSSDLIAEKYLKEKSVKILWNGITPATNVLYLAYIKDKVQPTHVEQMRNFIKTHINFVK